MKGDKLEDRIKACESIVANGGCLGSAAWCLTSKPPESMFPCPARGKSEAAKKAMGWNCCNEVASARAFLARHASPVAPDPTSVGQDAQGAKDAQERETIQGPRFDTTREKSKEGEE